MTTCANCRAPIPPGLLFCPRCRLPVTRPHDPQLAAAANATLSHATMAATTIASLFIQDGANTRTVPLTGTAALTIGRAPDNAVVLGALFVSGHHARIEFEDHRHTIVDVGARNGLYFDGQRVKQHVLTDGDVIRVPDPTTANFVSITYVNPLAPRVARAERVLEHLALPPDRAQATIGREGCDLVLDNPQVSRRHAVIERRDSVHVLRDLGATNGTYVNGERLRGEQRLRSTDVVQIGPFKLVYDGDSLDSYDQRGAMRIDARALRREVPDPRGKGRRVILDDVSLSIEPREFVALVGGSGTGKSTLMMALAGYVKADEGRVLVNGDDYYRNFDAYRSVLGYVPQDDILHRMLPVHRALAYSAQLKLPADTAPDEIARRVERVLDAVDMTEHKEKLIENLSGGQRKRVSIASELLNDPSLLFLDEPTSGLDPGLEKRMMFTLRQLADSGRTVVLVTHATANITQCDHVAFMAAGRMVYFGPPADALAFFGVTSGDFADIYNRLEGRADPASALVRHGLATEYAHWKQQNAQSASEPTLAELWQLRFHHSPLYQRYVVDRLHETPGPPTAEAPAPSAGKQAGPSAWRQFAILTRRYLALQIQDRRNLLIMLAQAPIIAGLLCLVAKDNSIAGPGVSPFEAKRLLFMLSTVGVWFGIINAAREICKELPIFRRERLANLRVGAYVGSKVAVLLLLVVVQSGLLLGVLNLRVGFPEEGVMVRGDVEMFVTTILSAIAGLALGLLISALSSSPDKAISVVPLALIPQILFAGMIFRLEGASTVLSWVTASRWAMDAFGATVAINDMPTGAGGLTAIQAGVADLHYERVPAHMLQSWGVLLLYSLACIIATAWRLRARRT